MAHVVYPDGKEAHVEMDWLLDHALEVVMLDVTGRESKRHQDAMLKAHFRDNTYFESAWTDKEECLAWIEQHRDRFFGVRLRLFGRDTYC